MMPGVPTEPFTAPGLIVSKVYNKYNTNFNKILGLLALKGKQIDSPPPPLTTSPLPTNNLTHCITAIRAAALMISNSYFNKSELTVKLLEPSLIVNVRSPTFDLYRRLKFILFYFKLTC